jgi:hypothetical protein
MLDAWNHLVIWVTNAGGLLQLAGVVRYTQSLNREQQRGAPILGRLMDTSGHVHAHAATALILFLATRGDERKHT